MSGGSRLRPPAVYVWLLRLAGLMVPAEARAAWRHGREAGLNSLAILASRGELPGDSTAHFAWLCRDALTNAFLCRCGSIQLRRWMRGPAFPIFAAVSSLLLLVVCTHGFSVTRSLLAAIGPGADRATHDRLVANLLPAAFALVIGIVTAVERVSVRGHSLRYLSFLLFKGASLAAVVVLLWIEGGAALRSFIPNQTTRVLLGGFVLAVAFIATFGWAMLWNFDDQQHRCPICLRRFVKPVTIGSWASALDPVTTEWICEDGHGSLCTQEIEWGRPDYWIPLAPSCESSHFITLHAALNGSITSK
jgi:hypothetical protein